MEQIEELDFADLGSCTTIEFLAGCRTGCFEHYVHSLYDYGVDGTEYPAPMRSSGIGTARRIHRSFDDFYWT